MIFYCIYFSLKSIHAFANDVEFLKKSKYQQNLLDEEEIICDRKGNESFMKEDNDMLEKSLFDRDIDIDDTIYQSPCKKPTNLILPESPVFTRKDEKSVNAISENEVSMNSDNTIIPCTIENDNKSDFNELNIGNNTSFTMSEQYLNTISLDNCSPFIVCNTPVVDKKRNKKNRKKLFKKNYQDKQQLNDNSVNSERKQMKDQKLLLQEFDNILSPSKINLIHDDNQINNKMNDSKSNSPTYYKFHRTSDDKKLRQTTLPFYTIKKKVDDTTLPSSEEDVTINKSKKFLFNYKSSIENIMHSKTINDRKIDIINLNDVNDKNEMISEEVIGKSPDYKHVQFQGRSQIKLKRKLKKTDQIEVTALSCNNSTQMQNKVCSTKNQNITIDDNSFLSPEMVSNNVKKKCLTFYQDIQLEQKLSKKNNSEGIACTKQVKLNPLQYTYDDETYFEETSQKENNINVNKEVNKNLLRYNVYHIKFTQENS